MTDTAQPAETREQALERKLEAEIAYLAPMDKGDHAPDHTKAIYEASWGKTLNTIKAQVAKAESLATVVLGMQGNQTLSMGGQRNRVSSLITRLMHKRMAVPVSEEGVPWARVGVVNGRYTLIPNLDPIELVHMHLKPTIKHVVELGSGRGNNLFMLHMKLGSASRSKQYWALEYTEAGRELTDAVSPVAHPMKLSTRPFDYTAPDISMIPDDEPALFFSVHSIEQVAEISPDLYAQLVARRAPTAILHFEPVGWQRNKTIRAARVADDRAFLRELIANRTVKLDSEDCQVANAAINSWRLGYNRNLHTVIEEFEALGQLRVAERVYDFSSLHPVNPTTYIKLVRPSDPPEIFARKGLTSAG